MSHYIDGFVLPIPRDRQDAYKHLVQAVAEIWKEHGALDYREYISDDLVMEGTRSFSDLAGASGAEAVVFGWVVFPSREARDLANQKVALDPRMKDLMSAYDTGFDAARMAYGGFRPLVPASDP